MRLSRERWTKIHSPIYARRYLQARLDPPRVLRRSREYSIHLSGLDAEKMLNHRNGDLGNSLAEVVRNL